jgi:hypothetical protein
VAAKAAARAVGAVGKAVAEAVRAAAKAVVAVRVAAAALPAEDREGHSIERQARSPVLIERDGASRSLALVMLTSASVRLAEMATGETKGESSASDAGLALLSTVCKEQ